MVIILLISTYEYWFRRYKKDDFNTEDKECLGQPKKFEDEEVEALRSRSESNKKNLQNH